ncbi:MAG: acetyl-CoA carboxylase carboxyltransferase subunit alpha [Candidatus Omnitrophica bacterium]|nr:acetyl-CoA carboxylase carboxyltransferase subunit alpha [Candidatus Omnitrophota bacterium]
MAGLDFEKPIIELEKKIEELKSFTSDKKIDLSSEVKRLEEKLENLKKEIYTNLTAWQKVQLARHPERPNTLDYINMMMVDFIELHGDRLFADDRALIGGFARLDNYKVMVIGHQKGRDYKEKIRHNFGMAHPEGYRKALRLMRLAENFGLPIILLVDTAGAFCDTASEERGQAQAIAENLQEMIGLATPMIAVVIGEGGSGGALGIGVADRVLVLENAYYSVISPEGCAAILWKDSTKAPEAAEALKLTAKDLLSLGVIDEIIPEPLGGAHRNPQTVALDLKSALLKHLKSLSALSKQELLIRRYQKFRNMGVIGESVSS